VVTKVAIKCKRIIKWLEEWAPKSLAMEGDRIGLLLGDPSSDVENVLVTLEITAEVVEEAVGLGVQLIVSHHPLFREPLSYLRFDMYPGNIIGRLIQKGINAYAAHTNLDAAPGGVNDVLARRLGLQDLEVLYPTYQEKSYKVVVFVPQGYEDRVRQAMSEAGAGRIGNYVECSFQTEGTGTFKPLPGAQPFSGEVGKLEKAQEFRLEMVVSGNKLSQVLEAMVSAHPYEEVAYDVYPLWTKSGSIGLGRVGRLKEARPLGVFAEGVKELLGLKAVRVTGDLQRPVSKVALCGGSGMRLLMRAVELGADVYLTGDVRHHEALEAKALGISLIDAGHHATERLIVPVIAEYLEKRSQDAGQKLGVFVSSVNTDPFLYL